LARTNSTRVPLVVVHDSMGNTAQAGSAASKAQSAAHARSHDGASRPDCLK